MSGGDLYLVIDETLFGVPFAALLCDQSEEFLFERYNVTVLPSLHAISKDASKYSWEDTKSVVIGLSETQDNIKWPAALAQEATTVFELLQDSDKVLSNGCSKQQLLKRMEHSKCIHVASFMSRSPLALVIKPQTDESSSHFQSDELLFLEDVRKLNLKASLVVLSASQELSSKDFDLVARAFLSAGAQNILLSLWHVCTDARMLFMKGFYESLLHGSKISQAVADGQRRVAMTHPFAHPKYWAAFLLIGNDGCAFNKSGRMGMALRKIMMSAQLSRTCLRVLLHLVIIELFDLTIIITSYLSIGGKVIASNEQS